MAEDINIESREELEAWLKNRPKEWAQIIALRAAIRVFPLAMNALVRVDGGQLRVDMQERLILQVWRAVFTSSLARSRPSVELKAAALAARAAANAARHADRVDNAAAGAAIFAANVVYADNVADVKTINIDSADRVASTTTINIDNSANVISAAAFAVLNAANAAASQTSVALYEGETIWHYVSLDCAFLDQIISLDWNNLENQTLDSRLIDSSVNSLSAEGLWGLRANTDSGALANATPAWIAPYIQSMAHLREIIGDTEEIITGWFDTFLILAPQKFKDENWKKLALQNDEFWEVTDKRPAEMIMAEAAKILDGGQQPEHFSNEKLLTAQQDSMGNKWIVEGERLRSTNPVFNTDRNAASDPATVRAHASLLRKVDAFLDSAKQFDESYGWQGFGSDYQRLHDALTAGSDNLAAEIWDIYDRTLTLASYIQQDNDLRKGNPAFSNQMLSAQHRRQLTDIVRSLAPFVRRFPSIQTEDENAANFMQRISSTLASSLLDSAHEKQIITDKDRELIAALLAAMERNGLPAEKAGIRGFFSVRNLVVASAMFIGSTVLQGTVQKVELYEKVTDWMADHVDEALEIAADAPDDIRIVIQEMVDGLDDAATPANVPRDAMEQLVGRRRKRIQKS